MAVTVETSFASNKKNAADDWSSHTIQMDNMSMLDVVPTMYPIFQVCFANAHHDFQQFCQDLKKTAVIKLPRVNLIQLAEKS